MDIGHGTWTSRTQTGYKGEHIGKTDKTGREGKKGKKNGGKKGGKKMLAYPASHRRIQSREEALQAVFFDHLEISAGRMVIL